MSDSARKQEAESVLADAEQLFTASEVDAAIERMATAINEQLADKNPVVLCLMTGALIPAGMLLPRLRFALEIDYVHATRYRNETAGGELHWLRTPVLDLTGRTVLLIDDILDEGITLEHIISDCYRRKADKVHTAVLADKQLGRPRALDGADFTGLQVPDRYVFGYGMDYKGYLRNAPGIYAVKEN